MHEHANDASYSNNPNVHMQQTQCKPCYKKVLGAHVKSRLCINTNTWNAYAMDLCTMLCVPSDQDALKSTCRRTSNVNYTSTHHEPMQFNQTKCSLMHEHVIEM